jgi:hypothetical protein
VAEAFWWAVAQLASPPWEVQLAHPDALAPLRGVLLGGRVLLGVRAQPWPAVWVQPLQVPWEQPSVRAQAAVTWLLPQSSPMQSSPLQLWQAALEPWQVLSQASVVGV